MTTQCKTNNTWNAFGAALFGFFITSALLFFAGNSGGTVWAKEPAPAAPILIDGEFEVPAITNEPTVEDGLQTELQVWSKNIGDVASTEVE